MHDAGIQQDIPPETLRKSHGKQKISLHQDAQEEDPENNRAPEGAPEDEVSLDLGMIPAVSTLRQNLPIHKLEGDNQMFAVESASYLWASGLWDHLMHNALHFKTVTEGKAPQLRTGIHASSPQIWQALPLQCKKD